jgi:hypothetical protein
VNERADLLRMLARIRRRARALAAIEGAVAGLAGASFTATIAGAIARARGDAVHWRPALAAASVAALVGACVAAARRISLVQCARWLDAAIDRAGSRGGSRAHDRALSALTFVDAGGARPAFVQAAIADAVARARSFGPAVVRPARRPAALPALAAASLALVVVGAWPARAPAARAVARPSPPSEPTSKVRVTAGALEAEREELRALGEAADVSGDVEMRAAAREARVTLDALTDGTLDRGEALDRLTALASRAREAAEQSSDEQAALHAAGKALEATAATRALGRALGADDVDEAAHALRDLADRAASSDDARAGAARAFGSASNATAAGGDAAGNDKAGDERRHLARERAGAAANMNAATAGDTRDRHLERLRRDLDDVARACRGDAAACATQLRERSNDVPRLAREAARAPARQRLETTVEQLRERMRRGDLDRATRDPSERRFARAANGKDDDRPSQREEGPIDRREGNAGADQAAGEPSMASGDGDDDVFSSEPAASGEAAGGNEADGKGDATSAGGGENGALAQGQGYGHDDGGDPLGRGATPPTRGRAREVPVRDGAGPTRSEVIEASARRGFAARDYVRVFEDYQPVVEESLATGAVPESRRYVVRRYFQLIRPRAH